MSQDVSNPVEFNFVCPLPNGLHARPASQLAEFAGSFRCELHVTNLRTRTTANLKSTLGILSADIRKGDECSIRVLGADDEAAGKALRNYLATDLPRSDEPLPEISGSRQQPLLPRALLFSGAECYFGLAVSSGIGKGKAVIAGRAALPKRIAQDCEDPHKEQRRVDRAVATVRERIRSLLSRSMSAVEAQILKAHLGILDDISFSEKIAALVAQGYSAGRAIVEAGSFFSAILQNSASPYIRDRSIDIQEICLRLTEEIYGTTVAAVELREPSILVAETLAPQQLLSLDKNWLQGLVLEHAGTTSHSVILARSLGIPTVVGVKDAPLVLAAMQDIFVDGNRGLVVPNGVPAVQRFYDREQETQGRRKIAFSKITGSAKTADGRRLEVAANVSSATEIVSALNNGAEGIGLFRTEMLFMGREQPPSENEQFGIYCEAVHAAAGRPLIIRTIDVGGDKPVPHLNLPDEPNPYLGYRGIRIYVEHRELFRTQLRALLRASAFGRLQIMAPMVSTLEEVRWLKQQIAEVQSELRSRAVSFDSEIRVGIMIEVPSLGFIIDQLCAEIDFLSIGTNDLNQYFLAVDRDNAKVAALSSVRHPSFLRFLKRIVDEVHRCGKWIGMCGEMAGDLHNLPILLGLGLDEISLVSSGIPALKQEVSRLAASDCEQLLARLLACGPTQEVEELLARERPPENTRALLDASLIVLESHSRSKDEAIRELIDALYIDGRTDNPDRLEDVVWKREGAYSTGLGHGFAVPHCRSEQVTTNSIAILKLKQPIEWNAVDGEAVSTVMLLAVRESDTDNTHMQVLAKMARKLMHEDFRNGLQGIDDQQTMLTFLTRELEIPL